MWRTRYSEPALYASMLRPGYESMPPALQQARAFHIGVHPERFELELLERLKQGHRRRCASVGDAAASQREIAPRVQGIAAVGPQPLGDERSTAPPRGTLPWLSVETFTTAERRVSSERLASLLEVADIFSPNEVEAASMLGVSDPEKVSRLANAVRLGRPARCAWGGAL